MDAKDLIEQRVEERMSPTRMEVLGMQDLLFGEKFSYAEGLDVVVRAYEEHLNKLDDPAAARVVRDIVGELKSMTHKVEQSERY